MNLAKFTVPIRLVSEANKREHWRTRAKRSKAQRCAIAMLGGFHVFPGLMSRSPLVVTMTRIAPRALDDDNATRSCKAVRDELAKLLGIDDRDPRVRWVVKQSRGTVRYYAVQIEIDTGGDDARTA